MKKLLTITLYILAFLTLPLGAGIAGLISSTTTQNAAPPLAVELNLPPVSKTYDGTKPVAVILAGGDLTGVSAFLGSYELFSASKAYNVYVLAVEYRPVTLSGGLEILPDMSLADVDHKFERDPDLIVIPDISPISISINKKEQANSKAMVNWVKKHASRKTRLLSWGKGASILAQAGLLDGRTATASPQDIDQLSKLYPKVNWVRGKRYIAEDTSQIITSAGGLSGLDATLYLLTQLKGAEFVKTLAEELHYYDYGLENKLRTGQYQAEPEDLIGVLNRVYKWEKSEYGLFLYDGIGELDLASFVDSYSTSFTTRLLTVASNRQILATRHGLRLIPDYDLNTIPKVERLLIPGANALETVPDRVIEWARANAIRTAFLHAYAPDRFAYDAPLEDLAYHQNTPTARLVKKQLEYQAASPAFQGADWPVLLILRPLLLGLLGLGIVFGICQFSSLVATNRSG